MSMRRGGVLALDFRILASTAWLLALALDLSRGAEAIKVATPHFKWGQTKEQVYLTIMVRDLDQGSVSAKVTPDMDFNFAARTKTGDEYALNFPLREDVKAELVKWEPSARQEKWGDAILVTLAKVHQHRWDVLMPDSKRFKNLLDKDWVREDANLEPEEEIPYYEDNSRHLVQLTEKNHNKTMAKNRVVVANLRFPWCTQCKTQDEVFVKVAKMTKAYSKTEERWKGVVFAVIDAREQRTLARQHGAQCSWSCEYLVYTDHGEDVAKVKAKWTEQELLSELAGFLQPAVAVFDSEDAVGALRENSTVCLGAFQTEVSQEYKLFKKVASLMRGKGAVFVAKNSTASVPEVSVWPVKQNFSLIYDGGFSDNGTMLLDWLRPRVVPLLQDFDWQLRETYETLALPIAKLWVNDEDADDRALNEHIRRILEKVARKYLGKLAFVVMRKSHHGYELKDFGLDHPAVYPAFGISSNVTFTSKKYALEVRPEVASSTRDFWLDAAMVEEHIASFCDKVLAGTWPEAHLSGPLHANWTLGELKKLAWKNWAEIQSPSLPLLIEVMGRFRMEHAKKEREAQNLAKALAPFNDSLLVASYDTADNYYDQSVFKRDKYTSDTEWYFLPQRTAGEDGPPKVKKLIAKRKKKDSDVRTIVEFLKKQSGIVGLDVDEVMKTFVELEAASPPLPSSALQAESSFEAPDLGGMGMGIDGLEGLGGAAAFAEAGRGSEEL